MSKILVFSPILDVFMSRETGPHNDRFYPLFSTPFLALFLAYFSPFSCFSSKNLEENPPFSVEGGKILAKNRQKSQFFALFSSRFFEEKTLEKMVENLSSRFFEEKSPILRFLHKMLSSYSARK